MLRLTNPGSQFAIRVFSILFALVLLYALTDAMRNGLADIYARPAKKFLQDSREAQLRISESEWQAVTSKLEESLKVVADDPDTLIELGRLHRIKLEDDALETPAIERHGEQAIDYYERSAALRPAWPWAWSSLAFLRYELYQESTSDFHHAIIRAVHFGPWEGPIQLLILDIGLDTWTSLSAAARKAVLATADRALETQLPGLSDIVDSVEKWQSFCMPAISDQFEHLRRQCKIAVPN